MRNVQLSTISPTGIVRWTQGGRSIAEVALCHLLIVNALAGKTAGTHTDNRLTAVATSERLCSLSDFNVTTTSLQQFSARRISIPALVQQQPA